MRLYHYRLPLVAPLMVKSCLLKNRRGFFLECENADGQVGTGEIAPLAGLHRENLTQVERELKDFSSGKISADELSVSCAFGVSVAQEMLNNQENSVALVDWCGEKSITALPINALLSARQHSVAEFIEQGYQAIKIKVGALSLAEDIVRVNNLHHLVHGRARIRIDANQSYSLEQALNFCESVGTCCIEYMEEPLQKLLEIDSLSQRVAVPLALDESLFDLAVEELSGLPSVAHWIIKPSRIGSLAKNRQLLFYAKQKNISCTISSCFETGISLSVLSLLAASYFPSVPAGLSTFSIFAADIGHPSFKTVHGHISLDLCANILQNLRLSDSNLCSRIF